MILRTSRQYTALEALVGGEWHPQHAIHQDRSRMLYLSSGSTSFALGTSSSVRTTGKRDTASTKTAITEHQRLAQYCYRGIYRQQTIHSFVLCYRKEQRTLYGFTPCVGHVLRAKT